jgi:16S rRNA (guanine527-N7)-methyltransferase
MKLRPAEQIHRDLLEKWRAVMNLVGPGPVKPHFVDAIGSVNGLNAVGRWADLGSGAGFPGLSLAIRHPEAEVLLVESRQKRSVFLRTVIQTAGLHNVSVFHGRVESVEPGFDGVISRAFRPPEDYLKDADRLLVPDGRAVLLSGNTAPAFEGWRHVEQSTYAVPDGTRTRTVLMRG